VAISPDVVSFVHDRFGHCDLRWGSGIHNVAGEASSMILAGDGSKGSLSFGVPEMMEGLAPLPLRRGLSLLYYDYIILCGLS
jgi:hypothetical protein